MTLSNGDIYTGELKKHSNIMHGKGILFAIQEELVYEGQFFEGNKHTTVN